MVIQADKIQSLVYSKSEKNFNKLVETAESQRFKSSQFTLVQDPDKLQELIASDEYSVVVLDIDDRHNELSDGLEGFTTKFAKRIPIIVFCLLNQRGFVRQAMRLGVQDYIAYEWLDTTSLTDKLTYAIERQKLIEDMFEVAQFKTQFLAQMSHEIRTPLNGMIGLTELLQKSKSLTAEDREVVDTIVECGDKLVTLVSDILDFSKIEAGKLDLVESEFRLRQLFEGTLKIFSQKAAEKSITLSCIVDPAIPSILVGDSSRLGQVLSNLVSNAVKFTDSGDITVAAKLVSLVDKEYRILIEVKDSGQGIPANELEHLFGEYEQTSVREKNPSVRSTGLGLSICKALVDQMGGSIGVKSTPKEGSCFYFEISLEGKYLASRQRNDLRREKVLLLSPSKKRFAILSEMLKLRRVSVVSAEETVLQLGTANSINFVCPNKLDETLEKDSDKLFLQDGLPTMVIFDLDEAPGSLAKKIVQAIRILYEKPSIPFLLVSKQLAATAISHSVNIEQLNGPLSQTALYQKLAKLAGKAKGNAPKEKVATKKVDSIQFSGRRVLVVDDDSINRKVAARLLGLFDIDVVTATSGAEGVDAVKDSHFDLVFMDYQMPVLDGPEASRIIRSLDDPDKKSIPIISLTGNVFENEKKQCIEAGMNEVITKPLTTKKLESVLSKYLTRTLEENVANEQSKELLDPLAKFVQENSGFKVKPSFTQIRSTIESFQDIPPLKSGSISNIKSLEEETDHVELLASLTGDFSHQSGLFISKLSWACKARRVHEIPEICNKFEKTCEYLGAERLVAMLYYFRMNADIFDDNVLAGVEAIAALEKEVENLKTQLHPMLLGELSPEDKPLNRPTS